VGSPRLGLQAINVKAVKLAACKRVVLLDYDAESGLIMFRHYHITAQPAGVSKRVRRLVMNKVRLAPDGVGQLDGQRGGRCMASNRRRR
jgi:hypothetical protein